MFINNSITWITRGINFTWKKKCQLQKICYICHLDHSACRIMQHKWEILKTSLLCKTKLCMSPYEMKKVRYSLQPLCILPGFSDQISYFLKIKCNTSLVNFLPSCENFKMSCLVSSTVPWGVFQFQLYGIWFLSASNMSPFIVHPINSRQFYKLLFKLC